MTWKCDICKNVNPNRVNRCLKCGAIDENLELTYGKNLSTSSG